MAPSSPRHESKIQGLSKTVGRAHSARQFRRTRRTGAARLPPHVRAARAVRAERPLPTSTTSKPDVKPALRVDDRGNFCQGTQTTRIQDTVVGCSLFFFSQPSKLECSTVGIRISQPNFQDLPAYFRENGAVPTFMAEWRRNPGGDGHEIGQSA